MLGGVDGGDVEQASGGGWWDAVASGDVHGGDLSGGAAADGLLLAVDGGECGSGFEESGGGDGGDRGGVGDRGGGLDDFAYCL